MIGFVSDGDGALAALTAGLKVAEMKKNGDVLEGDTIICTHICPHAPTAPHDPVPFMGSPIDMVAMNKYEVDPRMDAILTIDTTRRQQNYQCERLCYFAHGQRWLHPGGQR